MTYTYLITVPMIFAFALGNVIIKYREGFVQIPFFGIVPKPYQLWDPAAQATIFPLTLLFSIAWSFEMVTHLEELCFWLYLVNAGSVQQHWFHSPYFKIWVVGSVIAVAYMPIVTVLTRGDPLKCEAFTFLAGSIGSLSLTVWFTPILYTFPTFLKNLRTEGVDISTIVRLTKFSELNTIRIAMRFLFSVPLLLLGVDGVRKDHHINENMFATDLLGSLAAVGVAISSGITLVIFFPRSIEGEIAARDEAKERKQSRQGTRIGIDTQASFGNRQLDTYLLTSSPVQKAHFDEHELHDMPYGGSHQYRHDEEGDVGDLPLPIKTKMLDLTEANLALRNKGTRQSVNPMIFNFTSPIDLIYDPA